MHIVVISLERSTGRRQRMTEAFAQSGVAFDFLPAIDGHLGEHEMFVHYDRARCVGFYGKPLTPGAIGCFASHYLAWQRCLEIGQPLLIVEDDVVLLPHFRHSLGLLEPLMARYRLIRLCAMNEHPSRLLRQVEDMELIRFLRGPAGGQCYAVSPQGAAILLEGAKWWREPVDRYIDRFWTHGVQSLALRPFPIGWTEEWGSETRIWESKSTNFTFVRKIARAGEHVARHVYNLRQSLKAERPPH